MLLCGTIFCGGSLACAAVPTGIDHITYAELKNGWYEDLYLTHETESEPAAKCPEEWDFDTILHAAFNGSTEAGNVDWSLETVSHLLIKRRVSGDFHWITLYVKPIKSLEDFNLYGYDFTNASATAYEYAVVPSLYGAEGNFAAAKVYSHFDGIFVADGDHIYGTDITDGFCDTTRNFPSATVPTMNRLKPVDINTSIAGYDTGACAGNWMELGEEDCEYKAEDGNRVRYQREIIHFLSNRRPKLVKVFDSRIWLVKIEDQITDTADTAYNKRNITFSWTEIGDCNSEADLYYSGLSSVTEEWWNEAYDKYN